MATQQDEMLKLLKDATQAWIDAYTAWKRPSPVPSQKLEAAAEAAYDAWIAVLDPGIVLGLVEGFEQANEFVKALAWLDENRSEVNIVEPGTGAEFAQLAFRWPANLTLMQGVMMARDEATVSRILTPPAGFAP